MNITVMHGTESGNAELVADDVAQALDCTGSVDVFDLQDVSPSDMSSDTLYLIIRSTHGEGELPESAQPVADALDELSPDLDGITYAMFGMGDSTYENYSRGSERIDARLRTLGATRVGVYGRHDAASRDYASDLAMAWAESVTAAAPADAVG